MRQKLFVTISKHTQEVGELEAEVARLRAALAEACEEIEDWAQYAGDYFTEKHDLKGTVARLRENLK